VPVAFPGPWPRAVLIIADPQGNARRYIVGNAASAHRWAWIACIVAALSFLTASHFPSSVDSDKQSALRRAVLWMLFVSSPNISAMVLSHSPWFFHAHLLFPITIGVFIIWCVRQMMRYFDANLLAAN